MLESDSHQCPLHRSVQQDIMVRLKACGKVTMEGWVLEFSAELCFMIAVSVLFHECQNLFVLCMLVDVWLLLFFFTSITVGFCSVLFGGWFVFWYCVLLLTLRSVLGCLHIKFLLIKVRRSGCYISCIQFDLTFGVPPFLFLVFSFVF